MATGKPSLDELRRQIDKIDNDLHDLIMQRADIVELVGSVKGKDKLSLLAPGREAEIIRRLLSRHKGRFPRVTLVRLWRELISGMVSVQAPLTVAVFMPDRGTGFLELARDQYGYATTMTPWRSPGQVVHAVAEGSAQVGILPMPDRDEGESWWVSLTGDSAALPKIIGRLPFAGPGQGRGDGIEALAVGLQQPIATGYDRSWLAVETVPDISRARLRSVLAASGIEPTQLSATQRSEESWLHLVEISGHMTNEDPRLARLMDGRQTVLRAVVLGGYPVPLTPEELSE
jgi:chorismate mutase/prephenate dehydratase